MVSELDILAEGLMYYEIVSDVIFLKDHNRVQFIFHNRIQKKYRIWI